ncbi:MAG: hypothetical protein RLZZ450_1529, partial [Pseudomonadota bacterium]
MSSVFPPGVQLATRYRVLRLLETNHVGALYEAERFDASLVEDGAPRSGTGRRVALKWLRFAAGGANQLTQQRAAHARAASAVRHSHLAIVHDVALEGNSLFVVSELLLGESLRARLAPHAMPLHERLRALSDAMRALAFAHQRGLVHGGLHPGNIFLHQEHDACFGLAPVVKVHDFGTTTTTLAQSLAFPGERSAFGPHAYLDHAQLCGDEPDVRSDIYACSVLLYQALTGALPFVAQAPVELAIKLATSSVPSIVDRHPGLPASLDALIQQSLRKERRERPAQLEPLAALTSAYAETLAARELLARGDKSLETRRMIQPMRAKADAARPDTRPAGSAHETRPLPVFEDDLPQDKTTRLLTVIGAETSALQQPTASAVPRHSSHPPEYLAALREAEIAMALDVVRDDRAREERAHDGAAFAVPQRDEVGFRPPSEVERAYDHLAQQPAPVTRRTQRGLSAPPLPERAYELPQATESQRALGRASEEMTSAPLLAADPVLHTTADDARFDDTRVVEISRHPTVVGASPHPDADTHQQAYVEVVARTRVRPALKLAAASSPSALDDITRGLLSNLRSGTGASVSTRAGVWSAAVAAIVVVAGISVSFAMSTHREAAA